MVGVQELDANTLYKRANLEQLAFRTTDEIEDSSEVIGQARAAAAVAFGIGIARDGYNIFALGPPGTGKRSLVDNALRNGALQRPAPNDLCYVHNFEDPNKPCLLELPAGTGSPLRSDMEHLVEELRPAIASAFESDEYHARRQAIDDEFKEWSDRQLESIAERARSNGVVMLRTPGGIAFAPMEGEEAMSPESFERLPAEEQDRRHQLVEDYEKEVQQTLRQMPGRAREHHERVRQLNREMTTLAVGHLIGELREKYESLESVLTYLDHVLHNIIEHAREFEEPSGSLPPALMDLLGRSGGGESPLRHYQVNVLVDNGKTSGAPVVYEDNPTYDNLIGRIEHIQQFGALVTNYSLIKPGALHRANGGYLILDARKLLRVPYAWEALKRALSSRKLRIESLGHALSLVSSATLEPQPLKLDVQVILLGEPTWYHLLCAFDPEFTELFKVAADFDERIEATEETQHRYVQLLASIARREKLRRFDRTGIARVLEQSTRLAGDQQKFSAQISTIVDLLKEANYWAGRNGTDTVTATHVQQAIDAQIHRADRVRERVYEAIDRGTVKVETEGARPSQVNGLSVIVTGNFAFARPSRITARVRLGEGKLVDIEREVELGGPIHSKGVLILSGYLGSRYAPQQPLSLSASLVFEQSYAGIEGDSASSAELFALLSAIAEVPIKQSFAVTGSVNQQGEVQAVGAVNEKIEGFFDVCRARGLTGEHGVIIPAANIEHLMLKQDVIDAVANGRFHIFPIEAIDEGIELLTGMPAGERDAGGMFPPETFNRRVEERLIQLADRRRTFVTPSPDPARMLAHGAETHAHPSHSSRS